MIVSFTACGLSIHLLRAHRYLHSFPTRRSSDLRLDRIEIERIGGIKRRVVLDPAGIHQKVNAIVGGNLVVVVALWTDLKVPFEIFLPKRILAAVALDPPPFRKHPALKRNF